MNSLPSDLLTSQTIELPKQVLPVVIIGAGGIVNDAHLPAYQKRGIPVLGIYDCQADRAALAAEKWKIPRVFDSLEAAAATPGALFDLAVPPSQIVNVLEKIPNGAPLLIQKPMGEHLAQAQAIYDCTQRKSFIAAVNFQFKYSPLILAIHHLIAKGTLGTLTDIEFNLNIHTPWDSFPFLEKMDRVEIQVHSVHYLDAIRFLVGLPKGVYAQTLADPRYPKLKSTRSSILLNYGDSLRCLLSINHNYPHGAPHERAMIKVEGTAGAAIGKMGICMNYPKGESDTLDLCLKDGTKHSIPLAGDWFPDAFGNSMAAIQRYATKTDSSIHHSPADSLNTMRIVEACYQSHASQGTPLPSSL
jgi:predicted dehydrogenase